MAMPSPPDARARLLRDFAAITFLRLTGAALALFLILRVAAPWLVDLHQTWALWLAGLLLLLCPLLAIYVAWAWGEDRRRLAERLDRTPL